MNRYPNSLILKHTHKGKSSHIYVYIIGGLSSAAVSTFFSLNKKPVILQTNPFGCGSDCGCEMIEIFCNFPRRRGGATNLWPLSQGARRAKGPNRAKWLLQEVLRPKVHPKQVKFNDKVARIDMETIFVPHERCQQGEHRLRWMHLSLPTASLVAPATEYRRRLSFLSMSQQGLLVQGEALRRIGDILI